MNMVSKDANFLFMLLKFIILLKREGIKMKSAFNHGKEIVLLLLVLTIIVTLVGCGVPEAGQQTSSSSSDSEEQVNMRFLWWGGDSRNKATFDVINAYMAEHSNVKIEGQTEAWDTYFEKLLMQLAANSAPDIVQLDFTFVPDLVNQGKPFRDITTLGDKIDLSGFDIDFARSYGGGEGYLIGLPTGVNGICNIYNVNLANKLGIDMSNADNWTFEDLITIGQQVNQKDSDKYFIYFKKELYIHLIKVLLKQMNGNSIINDDYTLGFTKEEMTEIFKYVERLVDTKTVPPFEIGTVYETQIADNPDWLRERYVMTGTYASLIGTFLDASPFEIQSARFMVMDNPVDKGIPATPTNILSINDKSQYINAAAEFLDYFFNNDNAIKTLGDVRGVPSVEKAKDMLVEAGKIRPQIRHGADSAVAWSGEPDNSISLHTEIQNRLLDYIHEVGYKTKTPAEAAEAMAKDFLQIIDTIK